MRRNGHAVADNRGLDLADKYTVFIKRLSVKYRRRHPMIPLEVEDFEQAARVRLWQSAHKFDDDAKTEQGWVGTVAWRAMVEAARVMTSRGQMKKMAQAAKNGSFHPRTIFVGDFGVVDDAVRYVEERFGNTDGMRGVRRVHRHEGSPLRTPDRTAEAPANRDEVAMTLRVLLPRTRAVFLLYFLHGMSLREVGGVLGCSESHVSNMMRKTVLHLRAAFPSRVRGPAVPRTKDRNGASTIGRRRR